METRVFDRSVAVLSTDGRHSEVFSRGDRIKNIKRLRHRVMFEPGDAHRIAGTYAMDWSDFEMSTTAVRSARA